MTNAEEALADAVANATNRETFDVISFFSGGALPTEKVVIYRDIEAAYELNKIYQAEEDVAKGKAKKKKVDSLSIADPDADAEDAAKEEKIAEYRDRLKQSAVTFHLRGLAPKAQLAIEKNLQATLPYKEGGENPEYDEAFYGTLIAKTIQYVTNAAGAKDDSPWDADRVKELTENLPGAEFGKITEGVIKLTYAGNAIDRAVSADF